MTISVESDRLGEPLDGSVVAGKYRVLRLLGRGGSGSVYEVERVEDGAPFALKRLDQAVLRDEVGIARFAREVRAAKAIRSTHVVSIVDVGQDDGHHHLVMDLLRGEDLGQRLARTTRLALDEAGAIATQVLLGLEDAHGVGVIHRDLKPDNLFLATEPDGSTVVKILDFGVSKIQRLGGTVPLALTMGGVAVGTPLYMSPEQACAREDVDGRSDLYSVGAILFECITGRPPHVGETDDAVLESIRTTEAPPIRSLAPAIPERFAAVVDRSLAHEPSARFATARDMLVALDEAIHGTSLRRSGSSRRLWFAGAAALVAGAACAACVAWWLHR